MAAKKKGDKSPYAVALLRFTLGFTFLWAFFDKLFGLGFATCRNAKTHEVARMCKQAWLNGGSPTKGFLGHAVQGPFANFYHNLANNSNITDVLFMAGLLFIGVALIVGIGVKIAAITGSLLLFMMWTALLWPANNPVLDEHITEILGLVVIATTNGSQVWGLRNWWVKRPLVKNMPILE